MKILLFANTDWYLFNFRHSLIVELLELGCEVVAVSPPGPYGPRLEATGCRWVPLDMDRRSLNPLREIKLLASIAALYRLERPDLVHHFTIKCVIYGTLAAQLVGITAVINAVTGLGHVFSDTGVRARMLRPLVGGLMRLCLSGKNRRLILQNPDDRAAMVAKGLVRENAVRLIRGSGVNVDRFNPAHRRQTHASVRILLATRLLWEKGVSEYVEAARQIQRPGLDVEFLLAGEPDLGNPKSVGTRDIEGWRQDGVVVPLGHVEDMAALMQTVDIVVLPTTYGEGVPRSLLEAAASGLPIVTTDSPGCREIVEHEINGLLVPRKDCVALVRALIRLIENSPLRARMGAAGREIALSYFDERIVLKNTLAVYGELVDLRGLDV